MFTSIGSLLKVLPRRSKTPNAIIALHVRQAFSDSLLVVWPDLPGELLAKIKASVFKNGVLTIVSPQLVSAELSMRSGGLIAHINKVLGRRVVNKLRFRNG